VNEAIVLCGGLGTRLREVIGKKPKILAEVGSSTFLDCLVDLLCDVYQVDRIVLALGYEHNQILEYLSKKSFDVKIDYSIETTPLGTGGALKKAIKLIRNEYCLVFNGDTYFVPAKNINWDFYKQLKEFPIQMFSVYLEDTFRFGRLEFSKFNDYSSIAEMKEKGLSGGGWINTGYYFVQKRLLQELFAKLPEKFSLEHWLEESIEKGLKVVVWKLNGYFIDIGVPEDYYRFKDFIKVKGKIVN